MSELKEHLFCECDECIREYRGPLSNEMHPYYLKSEADKVIAEKDAEIAKLNERIADGDRDFEMANNQNERMLKIVRHHKYKRCLAMARWCDETMMSCELRGYNIHRIWAKKHELTMRWKYKWLELAEKFKEAK